MNIFRASQMIRIIGLVLVLGYVCSWSVVDGQNHRVVRIQVDACGIEADEYKYENFQFVTGNNSSYDLNTNTTSISISNVPNGTVRTIPGFVGASKKFIDELNRRVRRGTCPAPVFVNPFLPPYNGIIPPNSSVICFTNPNPDSSAVRSQLDTLCGKSPIFVLVSNTSLGTAPFFENNNNSTASRQKSITVTIGNLNQTIIYDAARVLNVNGSYVAVDPSGIVFYNIVEDGCTPFSLPCIKPSIIATNSTFKDCENKGFTLPEISDIVTGNAKYFTQPNRQGDSFSVGQVINTTKLLYANDFSACDPTTKEEKQITFTIQTGIDIDNKKFNTTIAACDSFTLIPITGTTTLSSPKYFLDAIRTQEILVGNKIFSTDTLFVYDINAIGCPDEDTLIVNINKTPTIAKINDTISDCDKMFTVPVFSESQFMSFIYPQNDTNKRAVPGEKISIPTTQNYIARSINGECVTTSVPFKISIDHLPKYTFATKSFSGCDTIRLPKIEGTADSTFYFTGSFGQGTRFSPGDVFTTSTTLYVFDKSNACPIQDTLQFIINTRPIFDLKTGFGGCDSFLLPADEINPSVRYYFQQNAIGDFLLPGQTISKPGTLYKYSGNAACHSEKPIIISIFPTPKITPLRDTTTCESYILPAINGTNLTAKRKYIDITNPSNEIAYVPGNTINQSGRFALRDSNSVCTDQTIFNLTINQRPNINSLNSTQQSCDTFRLPALSAVPNLLYFTNPAFTGNALAQGALVRTSGNYYARAGLPGCESSASLNIEIVPTPTIFPVKDTSVCGEFILPKILGMNLSATEHYHDSAYPKETVDFLPGQIITQSRRLYLFDWNILGCVHEQVLNITVLDKPVIDSILPIEQCEKYTLPALTGANLTNAAFYESPNGIGKKYLPGETISQIGNQRLYAFHPNPVCPSERIVDITIKDSITSNFTINDSILCKGDQLLINHTGLQNNTTRYNWKISGPIPALISNTPSQSIQLDTGIYSIQLFASGTGCVGDSIRKTVEVLNKLEPLKNLSCKEEKDRIIFSWDRTPLVTDYKVDLLQGPFGVRSPQQMIFSNLVEGTRVGIRVTPLAKDDCANGQAATLTCVARQCDLYSVQITDIAPLCSNGGPEPLPNVQILNFNPNDTAGIKRFWEGKGIINDLFYPSIAGPGNHVLKYTFITRDSCRYTDTTIIKVGSGQATILNTVPIECAPPSQRQFNIRMNVVTDASPYNVHYSYAGGRSAIWPASAIDFTLSANFGLIGDSITIDSIVDANGCKIPMVSNAGTFTFRAVKFISTARGDTTSLCDFGTKTSTYKIRIRNPNANDPLIILSGGGSIQDSFYISPAVPFNQRHQVSITHKNGCDTLHFDMLIPCACTPVIDSVVRTACEGDTVLIAGKKYTINNPTEVDTIPSIIIGQCDTIRTIRVDFKKTSFGSLSQTICPGDFIMVGSTIFDQNRTTGTVLLKGAAKNGCDSSVFVNLNVLDNTTVVKRDTICMGDSIRIDGILFNANHKTDTLRFNNLAANGCDSIIIYNVVVENLQANITTQAQSCSVIGGRSVTINNVTGGSTPYSYAYNTNNTSKPITRFPLSLVDIPAQDTFQIIIKSAAACTIAQNIAFNPINSGARLSLGPDRTIKLGDTVRLAFNANFTITSFRWLTANYLSCIDCRNPIAQPLVSTLYILEVSDANGCTARDTLRIIVDPVVDVFVPNIFNPNSANEINRALRIYPAPQIASIERITIYDRWGNVYADVKNPPMSDMITIWDGKRNGIDAPMGVYTYKITYTTINGRSQVKWGTITLIR